MSNFTYTSSTTVNYIPTINVWLEHDDAVLPTKSYKNAACYDLYSIETVTIPSKQWRYIENGVRLIIPENHYIRFNTRSSMGFINDLFVYPGILDASYSGNLKVKIYNFSDKPYTIEKGHKYAQFEVLKLPEIAIVEINQEKFLSIQETLERGLKGWGSSGK